MYLTRLRLDPRSAQARRDLADPYEMHRTLVRAFVADATQAPPRFLWRLEPTSPWRAPELLVQSSHAADWAVLAALPGYLQAECPWETKALALDPWLKASARCRFRLWANPTVTREGKRRGLAAEADQLGWLQRQGARHGFAVETVLVTGQNRLDSRKGDARLSLLQVGFEGLLQVTEPAALQQALAAGIGPGKAFGCGLLSLARCP
ncbi:type I-E CRISPR-associated protein Cas6/Cse3/CasE [Ideonella sp. B7]|uniref:type I-E CRISPR-associated protein Cas6/Cse3/CasE n=1 Tax=Ideonella benzenivorans TaxID=2831643 RepID=UPI001CECD3C4|nr:type I-E CRISPR-associated protein Cas6/Cse3/CasE [Ideonella benzenivorans]MCA6215587.1 type I-E CRISPR-associated protein Cas6/Cse3/CasE [Ideonella benzenivorans]